MNFLRRYGMAIFCTGAFALLIFLPKVERETTRTSPEADDCHLVLSKAGVNTFDIAERCKKIKRGEWPAGLPITAR